MKKLVTFIFSMFFTISAFAIDMNAGPIWNQQDAEVKCPAVCTSHSLKWSGNWTTKAGNRSVCGCQKPGPAPIIVTRNCKSVDIGTNPLMGDQDAANRCPTVCSNIFGKWNGNFTNQGGNGLCGCTICKNSPRNPRPINQRSIIVTKRAIVSIISGSHEGQIGVAVFSYDAGLAQGRGLETIEGKEISFNFLGKRITGKPTIELFNGQFKDLLWTATTTNEDGENFNFGFNQGFNRGQFNRPVEIFVRTGKSYFGYLDPDTYVDGAGVITYK